MIQYAEEKWCAKEIAWVFLIRGRCLGKIQHSHSLQKARSRPAVAGRSTLQLGRSPYNKPKRAIVCLICRVCFLIHCICLGWAVACYWTASETIKAYLSRDRLTCTVKISKALINRSTYESSRAVHIESPKIQFYSISLLALWTWDD